MEAERSTAHPMNGHTIDYLVFNVNVLCSIAHWGLG